MPFIGKTPETGAFRLIDSITTSATDTYALTVQGDHYFPASARNLIVSLNGVTQAPESAYTVSGSHIVFASALTASDVIDYILVIGDAVDIGTPSDGTVGDAQLKASLDLSGKTLTLANDQISGNVIDGGTISNFASTGIDDNATSTAITIDSSGDVGFNTALPNLHGWAKAVTLDTATNAGYELGQGGTKYGAFALQGDGRVQLTNFTANPLTFQTNNIERMRIDSGGSLLIGKDTPADLHNTWNHIVIGEKGAVISQNGAGGIAGIFVADNLYIDADTGNFAYQESAAASYIRQTGGVITFNNAASGTSGGAATLTERMRIDSNGNVGIGASTSMTNLAGYAFVVTNDTSGGGLTCQTSGSDRFAVYNANNDGYYDAVADHVWRTGAVFGGTERMRVTSSGDLSISGDITSNSNPVITTQSPQLGRRNLIINGAMLVWQRGTSSASTALNYHTVDRFWNYLPSGGTAQRSTDVPSGQGFAYSYRLTSNGFWAFGQPIELPVTGKTILKDNTDYTLSFWAKATASNSISVQIRYRIAKGSGTDTVALDTSTPTIGTSWARYSVTFNTGTVSPASTNKIIDIEIASGSAIDIYCTGVQFEEGDQATPFEYRSYGEELALCQRYYQKSYDQSETPGGAVSYPTNGSFLGTYNGAVSQASIANSTYGQMFQSKIPFKVPMRIATATITIINPYTGATGNIMQAGGGSNYAATVIAYGDSGPVISASVSGNTYGNSTGDMYRYHWTASAEL